MLEAAPSLEDTPRSGEPPRTCGSGARRRAHGYRVGVGPAPPPGRQSALGAWTVCRRLPKIWDCPAGARAGGGGGANPKLGHPRALLAFLYDWLLFWVWDSDKDNLLAVLDQADDDDWRRRLRETLRRDYDPREQQSLLRAPEAVDQPPLIFGGVAYAILKRGTAVGEARALLREAQQRNPEDLWINLYQGNILLDGTPAGSRRLLSGGSGQPSREQSGTHHAGPSTTRRRRYGRRHRCLSEGHSTHFQSCRCPRPGQGPGPEGRAAGGAAPSGQSCWKRLPRITTPGTGMPSSAQFLANDEAYRWARRRSSTAPETAPTTGPWPNATAWPVCFCRFPGRNSERAVALTDLAVATGPKFFPGNAWPQFVKGLATYRQGRPQQAVPLLEESADLLPNRPGPRLALAMAQFQSG